MSEENKEHSEEMDAKVQIFSNNDEKLKFLGKILNSNSSREILLLLIEKEMTANEISQQTKQSLSLVIHHLNKMMQSGIVTISKIESNSKNQLMKFYTAKSGIIILPEKASAKAKQSKSFSNSLRSIMKFAGIGLAGLFSYLMYFKTEIIDPSGDQDLSTDVLITNNHSESLVISLIVIIIGISIVYLLEKKKKRVLDY
ncbi:MAG: winged helix-turn-helix transcriptional regulator [Nitrosopumilaceae archaeon]|nr:winged helix-turn-helix transcriptional regulator [Nitrosopumilaceae archaeon]